MAEPPTFLESLRRAAAPRFELVRALEERPGACAALARARADGGLVRLQACAPAPGCALDLARLEAELARHARVVHERLLPVLDLGRSAELVWIAWPELEQAVSVRTWLERERRLPFLESVRVLRECAQGLAQAHALGSLHLDLRPELVLWSETHVRIRGLGLRQALIAAGEEPRPLEREGASADLHALGALGFELLVGEPPPADGPPPSPAQLRAHVPPGLARLVVRCLARAPRERPSDMREAGRLLEGLVTPVPDWQQQLAAQAQFLQSHGREAEAAERLARLRRLRAPPPSG
jgi:serine/threonine-protein kinase